MEHNSIVYFNSVPQENEDYKACMDAIALLKKELSYILKNFEDRINTLEN